jgi:hypothetical protein
MFLIVYCRVQSALIVFLMISQSILLTGCGVLKERTSSQDPNIALAESAVQQPLSPEETEALVSDVANNWFYGQGLGETMLAVGTVVIFPPYGIYLAGNALLSLSGYEEIRVTEALPDSGEDVWNSVYDGVTSVPGHVTATISGDEFVSKKMADQTLQRYLDRKQVPAADEEVTIKASPVLAEAKQDSEKAWR